MKVYALGADDQTKYEKSHDITVLVRADDGQLYALQTGEQKDFGVLPL